MVKRSRISTEAMAKRAVSYLFSSLYKCTTTGSLLNITNSLLVMRHKCLIFMTPVVEAWEQMLYKLSQFDAGHNWQLLCRKNCAKKITPSFLYLCVFILCVDFMTEPVLLILCLCCASCFLCRSRLADYKENCGMTPHAASTCPNQDNHQACLASFARLIGTDVTPNYVDSSFSNWTISPWCTCKGSGNQEEECQNFLRYFTNNACLRNAIQAFGYGIDNTQNKSGPVPGPSATPKPDPVSTQEISENLPVTIPKYHQPRGGVMDLGEDHSSCLHASVWALLPSLALALVLAQHAL